MRIFSIVSLCAALSCAVVRAAEPAESAILHLTLQKAIQMALSRNFEIQVDAFAPQIAREQVTQELGAFDPNLSASYTRNDDRNLLFRSESDNAELGVNGRTPWGLTYDVGVVSRNNRGSTDDFNDSFNTSLALGLRQPLLRDFGPTANLARLRIARKSEEISEWTLRQRVIDIVTQIYGTYNELQFAKEDLRVAERSQALAQQLLQDNTRRAEIGVMSPLDITTARAEVAARKEAVIVATGAVRDREVSLLQLVTDHIESLIDTRVEITPPQSPAALSLDVSEGIDAALKARPDYQTALLDIQRRKINLAFQRNQGLPRLDLTGSLNLLGVDPNFGGSVGNTGAGDETQWSAGAVFSVPIPNRAGRGRINQAQLESVQALVDLKRLEQSIVVRIDGAVRAIVTARERINSTSEASVLARESLQAGEEKLRAGTATTFEVLELQKKLAEADAAELRARADFNKAVAEYDRQTGTTLERNNIALSR